MTGIMGIEDARAIEPLEILLKSLNSEAELSESGAVAMEQRLLRLLKNRLLMFRDIKEYPEILEQEILPPLIISGAGRTGSTRLHKMLSASGDFRYLPFWQGYNPSLLTGDREECADARIDDADSFVRWFDEHAPNAKNTHPYGTFEPEEENLIIEHNLCSPYAIVCGFIPSFMSWWQTQDPVPQLTFIKTVLKYLQWQFKEDNPKPWILKCPFYPGLEPLLLEVFPGAHFIATHRDPKIVIPSSASVFDAYHKAYSDVDRSALQGQFFLQTWVAVYENYVSMRANMPDLPILDIIFRENIADGPGVTEKIYNFIGLPLRQEAKSAMRNWDENHGKQSAGKHRYTLEDYAIEESVVERSCDAYIKQFEEYF